MDYQDYIWDLGGTLLNNYETSTAAFVETLAGFGIQVAHDDVYKALKVSTPYAVAQFAPNIPAFLQTYKVNEARELAHPVLFEGAADLLKNIVAQGGRNFLISHRNDQVLEILDKTGISGGILVGSVSKGSPAYDAGIKEGDIIYELDDTHLENMTDYENLLESKKPKDKVKALIYRVTRNEGKKIEVEIEIGDSRGIK